MVPGILGKLYEEGCLYDWHEWLCTNPSIKSSIYCLSVISLFFSLTTYDALCPLKPAFSKGPKFDRGSPCPLNVPLSSCLLSCPLSLPPSLKERGNTPLHVASQAGQAMQVELLIIHGANPCTLDGLGHTPEECARSAVTSLKTNLRES